MWKSDGTETGTVLVKDINPNNDYNKPNDLVAFNNKLFFNATDGNNGWELWVSDGTDSGTYMLKDINANGDSFPNNLLIFKNTLFFIADDGVNGAELWKSDGTETGTILIKNINNNNSNSINNNLVVSGDFLFFFASSDDHNSNTTNNMGRELWKSDGTEAGTVLVKDINVGSDSSNYNLKGIDLNGLLIFEASDGINGNELWSSDGTEIGTTLIKNINNANFGSIYSNDNLFIKLNNKIYFLADDNIHGKEIWKTDGTETGTSLVKDINLGNNSIWIEKFHVDEQNSKLFFFTTSTNSNERSLWYSDGTESGTTEFQYITTPNTSGTEQHFCNFNGKTFFSGKNLKNGNELFFSDGTVQGTQFFEDLNYSSGSSPAKLTDVNGKIFFRGTNEQEYGNQLFSSDGTINGTTMVKELVIIVILMTYQKR